jgi:hypothetical protein
MNKLEPNVLMGLSHRQEVENYITELKFQYESLESQLKEERRNIIGQFIIWMGGEHHFKPKGLEFWIDAFFESITSNPK